LAMRLNPRYGTEMSEETVAEYQRLRSAFRAQYVQRREMQSEEGLIRTLGIDSSRYWHGSNSEFDRGFGF